MLFRECSPYSPEEKLKRKDETMREDADVIMHFIENNEGYFFFPFFWDPFRIVFPSTSFSLNPPFFRCRLTFFFFKKTEEYYESFLLTSNFTFHAVLHFTSPSWRYNMISFFVTITTFDDHERCCWAMMHIFIQKKSSSSSFLVMFYDACSAASQRIVNCIAYYLCSLLRPVAAAECTIFIYLFHIFPLFSYYYEKRKEFVL